MSKVTEISLLIISGDAALEAPLASKETGVDVNWTVEMVKSLVELTASRVINEERGVNPSPPPPPTPPPSPPPPPPARAPSGGVRGERSGGAGEEKVEWEE